MERRGQLQIVRVPNGGTPEGADWHRRLLDRPMTATENRPALLPSDTARALGLLLGFRHGVRHLYGDDLDPDLVAAPARCPDALAESGHPSPPS